MFVLLQLLSWLFPFEDRWLFSSSSDAYAPGNDPQSGSPRRRTRMMPRGGGGDGGDHHDDDHQDGAGA